MASNNFKIAARSASRQPRILMSVESRDEQKEIYGSTSDWMGSLNQSGVDYELHENKMSGAIAYDATLVPNLILASVDSYRVNSISTNGYLEKINGDFLVPVPPAGYGNEWQCHIYKDGVMYATSNNKFKHESSEPKEHRLEFSFVGQKVLLEPGCDYDVWVAPVEAFAAAKGVGSCDYVVSSLNASFGTTTINFGATLDNVATFEVSHKVPSGTTVQYTVYGSNASDFSSGFSGVLTDGDQIGSVGYRYYKVEVVMTSSNENYVQIDEIRIGDGVRDYFGTHRDVPFVGVLPLLAKNPIGTLSSKIDLKTMPSTGECSCKMLWVPETSNDIHSGFLKNKEVKILLGFDGLSTDEYEPIFSGSWYDYTGDNKQGVFNIKIRDRLKQFSKKKVPEVQFNTDGTKSTSDLVYTEVNIIQLMLNVISECGIPDKFVDVSAFTSLRDNYFNSNDWKCTRTISKDKPEEAFKILSELSVLSGCFLFPKSDGKLSIVRYTNTPISIASIDADTCDYGVIRGNYAQLYTRQYIYYDPTEANPSNSPDKYNYGYVDIDGTAEVAWGEESQHQFLDKFKVGYVGGSYSKTCQTDLAERWADWFANPKIRVTLNSISLQYIDVEPGKVVTVDNLQLPCATADWPGYTSGKKFLIMGRTINPNNCTLSWDLMEI